MDITISDSISVTDITPPVRSLGTAVRLTAASSGKVSMGNIFNYTDAVSIGGWFKWNSTTNFSNSALFASKGGISSYFLIVGSGNALRFAIKSGGAEKSTGQGAGLLSQEWYFVMGTYDKDAGTDNLRFYLYNQHRELVSKKVATVTGAIDVSGGAFELAHDPVRGYYVDIEVDEITVYDRQLTDAEVEQFATLSNPPTTNLQGYYKFEEGSGTTALDSSGNGRNGTISGGSAYVSNVGTAIKTVLVQDHMEYVTCVGTKFHHKGNEWIPMGGNLFGFGSNGISQTQINTKLDLAATMNLNTVRIVNFFGSQYNYGEWLHVDALLDTCRQREMKVLLDLSDYCSTTGDLTGENCLLPVNRDNWYAFVDWLFNRRNSVNGRFYKDDDTIAIVSIVGEVGYLGGTVNRDCFADVSARIKANGAKQIIHAGGQIPEIILSSEYDSGFGAQQDMLSVPTIDCVSTHPYYTQADMTRLFPLLRDYSKKMNKPWFIEEFGYRQEQSTDQERSEKYEFVFNIGKTNGSAGFLIWSLDGGVGAGYGVNPGTPITHAAVKNFADEMSKKAIDGDPSLGGWVTGVRIR